MNPRHRMSLTAGAATLLATAPLATIFDQWTWAIEAVFAVTAVVGAAMLARQLRTPLWAQVLAMLAALTIIITWFFGAGTALLGTFPTGATVRHWADLVNTSGSDIRSLAVPVPDRQSLLFLASIGIGAVAIVIDVCVVGLRRPALAGMAMLPLYSVPVMVRSGSVMFLSFAIAAAGYLWLLASDNVERVRQFGRRFTGDGRDVDAFEPSPLAAAGRRLAVVGVLVAVLVPVAVPGMTGGLVDGLGTGSAAGSGTGTGGNGTSVSLFAQISGQLTLKQTFVMVKVTTPDPNPYYLRLGLADQLTPQGFGNHTTRGGQPITSTLPDPTLDLPGVTQNQYHASVEIVNLEMGLLPIYTDLVRTQKLDNKWAYDPGGQLVYSTRSSSKGKKYTFDYVHTTYSPAALREAPSLSVTDPMVQQFTAVPPNQQIADLVDVLTTNATTDYDRVRALYDYFSESNGFAYSLNANYHATNDAILEFLFNGKTGFCEQYAAALAWLVRQAGIPARVAFGFTRGGTRDGQTASLTNQNLHAWTEVYFSGYGWVPFDATPASHVSGSAPQAWAPDVNQPSGGPTAGTSTASPGAGGAGGPNGSVGPKDPDAGLPGQGAGSASTHSQPITWPWWVVGVLIVLVLLLTLPAVRRARLRRQRLPASQRRLTPAADAGTMQVIGVDGAADVDGARTAAHRAWDELIDTLVDFKVPMDPAETPRVTAVRVVRRLRLTGTAEEAATLVARAEERARYARTPLTGQDLADPVRRIRRALRESVSRRTRWSAALFPRSVLRRWRAGFTAGTIALSTAAGRASEALTRRLDPRRVLPGRTR